MIVLLTHRSFRSFFLINHTTANQRQNISFNKFLILKNELLFICNFIETFVWMKCLYISPLKIMMAEKLSENHITYGKDSNISITGRGDKVCRINDLF